METVFDHERLDEQPSLEVVGQVVRQHHDRLPRSAFSRIRQSASQNDTIHVTDMHGKHLTLIDRDPRTTLAAQTVARFIHIATVPTSTVSWSGNRWIVREWVPDGMTAKKYTANHPDAFAEIEGTPSFRAWDSNLRIFDLIICNAHRTDRDWLILADDATTTPHGMCALDQSNSFGVSTRIDIMPLPPVITDRMLMVLKVWRAQPNILGDALKPFLATTEIQAIHQRRNAVLASIDERIVRRGRERVVINE